MRIKAAVLNARLAAATHAASRKAERSAVGRRRSRTNSKTRPGETARKTPNTAPIVSGITDAYCSEPVSPPSLGVLGAAGAGGVSAGAASKCGTGSVVAGIELSTMSPPLRRPSASSTVFVSGCGAPCPSEPSLPAIACPPLDLCGVGSRWTLRSRHADWSGPFLVELADSNQRPADYESAKETPDDLDE